ncbi:MAG: DUF4838 domain-containing protein [Ruminococcaceae bacterium]|nr:DUF4838 domain-containing protein [Oscillospiraceae bacterium]
MKELTICGADISEFSLVLPENPAPALKTAAVFLQRVVDASCGVTLPIAERAEHGIFVGTRSASDDVKWDGYRITAQNGSLYLDGNIPRGTLYAAYSFAERYLGYRYFADDCEVVPTEGKTAIPCDVDIIDNPVFEVRRTTCASHLASGEFSAHCRLNDCMPVGEEHGGTVGITGGCHTFDALCPPSVYFKEHPEYYSYRDGRHYPTSGDPNGEHGQLCLTNPDVVRIVTENVLKWLREHPGQRVVEVSHADNRCYCMCEKCRAVYEEEGAPSGTLIRFLNAVAEEVEKEFPDVLIRTFAYQYTRKPPKLTKAHPSILVRYCTIEACFRHALDDPHCETNAKTFGPELLAWQKMASNISIWDYVTNWRCYNAPFPNLHSLRENARFFADCHVIHVLSECNAGSGGGVYPVLKAYLLGKLLWNPYMSEEEYDTHINEFLRAYYGKGWESIRRYIDMEHELTAECEMGCWAEADMACCFSCETPRIWDHIASHYNPEAYQPVYPGETYLDGLKERIGEVNALFDRAEELAETEAQKRHLLISRMSIRYVELFCMPHEKGSMTEEARAAYEGAVEEFLKNKEEYDIRYNVWTSNYLQR